MTAFVDHLDALTTAPNVEELWALHTKRMASYGFDRLIYGFSRYLSPNSLGDPQDWVILTNHGDAYMKPFIDEGLYWHAPMLQWALENDGACRWRWMSAPGHLTANEERVVKFNRAHGVTAGYTLSFRSVSQRAKAAMAITAKKGMTQ
ncbi:MAG: autoinducer binding domain-containing protein, partial [Octadecabacter sp.]